MNNQDKALIYDQCIRDSDRLQRENSKLKSQYPINVPDDVQKIIDGNNAKIAIIVKKLESLFR
jgi:hypothetical protein